MKLYLPQLKREAVGGGWSFARSFAQQARGWAEFVDNPMKADIYFVPSATMVGDKYEPEKIKANGAKIVLRVDNALKNSNNRNTGMPRMKKFGELADLVIYQSEWARGYLEPFVGKSGPVVLNGINQDIFKPDDSMVKTGNIYLYSRSSRDDQKGWHRAWYEYQMIQRENPEAQLRIVGRFSQENLEYNFDFFMGEKYLYLGHIQTAEAMARIYQDADYLLFTAYNDAASNTLIEALSCGVKIYPTWELTTGGTPEIIEGYKNNGLKWLSAERMVSEYRKAIESIL